MPVTLNSDYSRGHGLLKKKRDKAWDGEIKIDLSHAWAIMDSAINNQIFPGAQVFIAKNGQIIFNGGFGFHDYEKGSSQVSKNSIYDIASITKVLSITPIIMKLISRKKISLDQPVNYFLPDFRGKQKDKAIWSLMPRLSARYLCSGCVSWLLSVLELDGVRWS